MREFKRSMSVPHARRRREAFLASFACAIGVVFLWAVVGHKIVPASLSSILTAGCTAFVLTSACLLTARIRGLAVLWSILVLVWCAFLSGAFRASSGGLVQFAHHMPIRIAIWSFAALPLWASTELLRHSMLRLLTIIAGCLWLIVAAGSAKLAAYAPDVGGLHVPRFVWMLFAIASVAPLLVGTSLVVRTWKGNAEVVASPD